MSAQLSVSFTADISRLEAELPDWAKNRLPSVIRNALNDTARDAVAAETERIAAVFDRPTPYTLKAVRFPSEKRATKDHLVAEIEVRDEGGRGIAPVRYLWAEYEGGPRRAKRFEVALRRVGLMYPGEFGVVAKGYPTDAFGNLPGPLLVRILSQLQAFGQVGFRANETARSRKRNVKRGIARYFVPDANSKLRRGVYERQGPRIKPVIIFVRQPSYQKRWPFGDAARTTADRVMPIHIARYFAAEVAKRTR